MTDRPALFAAAIARNIAGAQAAFDAGFASEARRKEALAYVSNAYRNARDLLAEQLFADFPAVDGRRGETFEALYYGIMDLHQWKPKHDALFAAYPLHVALVNELVELRAAIKEALVEPKPVREDHALLAFAKTASVDLAALRDRRAGQYRDALDLGRKLGGLPVYVNRVFCQNYGGTTWVRLDWFLRGRRVPFNTIAAAYDQLVREGVIKEEA